MQIEQLFFLWVFHLLIMKTGAKNTCDVPAVMEGQPTNITCFFDLDVVKKNKDLVVQHYDENNLMKEILSCLWLTVEKPTCTNHSGYPFDGRMGDTLMLRIPSASDAYVGTYTCLLIPSSPADSSSCSFTLKEFLPTTTERAETTTTVYKVTETTVLASTEEEHTPVDKPDETEGEGSTLGLAAGVVVAVVAVLVIVCAVIIYKFRLVGRYRKRLTKGRQTHAESSEPCALPLAAENGSSDGDDSGIECGKRPPRARRGKNQDASLEAEHLMPTTGPDSDLPAKSDTFEMSAQETCHHTKEESTKGKKSHAATRQENLPDLVVGNKEDSTAQSQSEADYSQRADNPLVDETPEVPPISKVHEKSQNEASPTGNTAELEQLFLTCKEGDVKQLVLLLKTISVKSADHEGRTPLHIASQFGHADLLTHIIWAGCDVNAKDNQGQTPLHCACTRSMGRSDYVQLSEITTAKESCDMADPRPSKPDSQFETVVKSLLSGGASPQATDNAGRTPLHLACQNGSLELVKLLLRAGANVKTKDKNGFTPFDVAFAGGNEALLVALLEAGSTIEDRDEGSWAPLHWACTVRNETLVDLLLKAGANVERKDKNGKTPLHAACQTESTRVVELLLAARASTEARDDEGRTPLHLACQGESEEIVQILLDAGAGTEERDNEGLTPLHLACQQGNKEIVEMLLEIVTGIEARDKDGQTPLHHACREGKIEIVRMLVEKGADIEAKNKTGSTPSRLARTSDHSDIARELQHIVAARIRKEGKAAK